MRIRLARGMVWTAAVLMMMLSADMGSPVSASAETPLSTKSQARLWVRVLERSFYLDCVKAELPKCKGRHEISTWLKGQISYFERKIRYDCLKLLASRGRRLIKDCRSRLSSPDIIARLGPSLGMSQESLREFLESYLKSQIRLVEVFPESPNEVLKVRPDEVAGWEEEFEGRLALTFDDGPTSKTLEILKILKKAKAPATFFLLKNRSDENTNQSVALIRKIKAAGHAVGIHGVDHRPLDIGSADSKDVKNKMSDFWKWLSRAAGAKITLFRAPYGRRAAEHLAMADALGLRHILWNIDSLDWRKDLSASQMKQRILTLARLYGGGIVLFHEFSPKTIAVLPDILRDLKEEGFQFIRVDSMVGKLFGSNTN